MRPIKVVTFGRSSENDVVLNDIKASRVHCQIVQHDNGSFSVVDFGSTNGTYVNGVRVNGQAPLRKTDRVQVAGNELFWQKYFATEKPKSISKGWLWGGVSAAAVAFIALVVLVLQLVNTSGTTENVDIRFAGQYPSAAMVSYDEGGQRYTVEAVQGQVIIFFNENVSHDEAVKAIHKVDGKVVAQMPNVHYYLVEVGAGNENRFMQQMRNNIAVKDISLNAVSKPCSPKPYVMDLFYETRDDVPHGRVVSYAMKQCGHGLKTIAYEEGNKGNNFITSEILADLKEIVTDTTEDEPVIINMSFGYDIDAQYWKDASEESKRTYKHYYIAEYKKFISIVKKYDAKDFIIVKAAGNEGVKEFEKEIISPLLESLNAEERQIMNRHFLIVSAKDTRDTAYSNELEGTGNNSLVTKVDISDFKYNGKNIRGTSIAAPRAGCYITSTADKYKLKATAVLEYVREATRLHPEHLLTLEMLDSLINTSKKEPSIQTSEYVDLGLSSGTLWKSQNETGLYDYDEAIQQFGGNLPSKEHFEELQNQCRWTWLGNGYRVDGPNGNFITLSVTGFRDNDGGVYDEGHGFYWTSTSFGSDDAYFFNFASGGVGVLHFKRYLGQSVRLVKGSASRSNAPSTANQKYPHEASGIIPYSSDMFDQERSGVVQLSNGDRLRYTFKKDMDFFPSWLIEFKMDGVDIRKKYKVAALTSLDAEKAYIGDDDSFDNKINVMISVGGFLDMGQDNLYVIVKKK